MKRTRLAVVIPALAGTLLAAGAPAIAAPAANTTGIPDRYASQTLDWHTCTTDELSGQTPPAGAEGIECATYSSPRDWDAPNAGVDVTIAVSRLKATGESTESTFVNPGGPGAPGRMFPRGCAIRSGCGNTRT